MNVSRLFLAVFSSFIQLTFAGVRANAEIVPPKVIDGVLDLRDWHFDPGRITLSGDWRVHWQSLDDPDAFFEQGDLSSVLVPDDWGDRSDRGRPFHKTGYATYGVKILMPESHPELAIEVGSLYYASRVYFDGKLMKQTGTPGSTAESEKPGAWTRPGIVRVPASTGQLEKLSLVVQISNHIHANGGFRADMYMGEAHHIIRGYTIDIAARVMLIGAALLLALYHFILFLGRREERAFFSFSMFLLAIAAHGICSLGLMLNIAPGTSATIMLHIEYLSLVLATFAGVTFIWNLYPETRWRPIYPAFLGIALLGVAVVVLTTPLVFTSYLSIYKLGVAAGLAVAICCLVVAVAKRLEGATTFLVSMGIMAAGVGYGLVTHSVAGYALNGIVYLCMSAMILAQATVLGRRVTSVINTSEILRLRLQKTNENLEGIVAGRTKQLKKAAEEAHTALADSQCANRVKSEFLTSMSHELRTPLNAVLGFAQILQFDSTNPLTAKQIKHVECILDGGNHLLELVNQVLDLARVEADQLELSLEDVNVGEIIEDCVAMTIPLGKPDNITIINEFDCGSTCYLHTDRLRLKQVLINLLSNAVKYNNDGGTVTITGQETGHGFLRIFVTDTGIGIAERDHPDIFQMFHRLGVHAGQAKEGTGIGLSVTRGLVEKMAGRIGFESEEGIGSNFWIELPLASNEQMIFWDDTLSAGIDVIDKDHQVLISLVNKISQRSVDASDLDGIITELGDYTRHHFGREEAMMEAYGYPDLEAHCSNHRHLVAVFNQLAEAWHKNHHPESLLQLREFLRNWYLGHILKVDGEMARYVRREVPDLRKIPGSNDQTGSACPVPSFDPLVAVK